MSRYQVYVMPFRGTAKADSLKIGSWGEPQAVAVLDEAVNAERFYHDHEADYAGYVAGMIGVIEIDANEMVDQYIFGLSGAGALQARRLIAGMSQSQLAERAGINVRVLQNYEQGVRSLNGAAALTVYKLAQALGCKVEDLLDLSGV